MKSEQNLSFETCASMSSGSRWYYKNPAYGFIQQRYKVLSKFVREFLVESGKVSRTEIERTNNDIGFGSLNELKERISKFTRF